MASIDVRSEISGTVWKIEAGVGKRVGEDEPILVLESMKMEIPLVAPQAGKVVEILVEEGAMVSEDDLVARLEV